MYSMTQRQRKGKEQRRAVKKALKRKGKASDERLDKEKIQKQTRKMHSVRIGFININRVCTATSDKTHEMKAWLNSQLTEGDPVHALLLAEPVITPETDMHAFSDNYALTDETKGTELSNNPHLDTRALFMDRMPETTITENTKHIKPQHKGITWLKIHSRSRGETACKDVHVASVYIPNKNRRNPQEYIDSIYSALTKHVIELTKENLAVLVMMDANSPHRAPWESNGRGNRKALYAFIENTICKL
jgi:exonuclease III